MVPSPVGISTTAPGPGDLMRHGLPKHALMRLQALDLTSAMLDSVAHPVSQCTDATARDKAVILCARIEQHRARAFALTVGGETLDLTHDDKASGRYSRAIEHMRETITNSWGDTVDAAALVTTVMGMVAQAEEQLPRTFAYIDHRAEWGHLHARLAELYEIFDPAFDAIEHIEHGAMVAERMVAA